MQSALVCGSQNLGRLEVVLRRASRTGDVANVEVVEAKAYREFFQQILLATTGLDAQVDCAGPNGKIFIVEMKDGHVMVFYSLSHFCNYMYARNKSHQEALINKKLSDGAVAALTLAEVTTVLDFAGFAAVMATHPTCLEQVFGGPVDGAGLKGCEEYDKISSEHAKRNFAPQRALVELATKLRKEGKSDAEILRVLQ